MKPVDQLVVDDFKKHPNWEFDLEHEAEDDTLVVPVVELPVDNLDGQFIGRVEWLFNMLETERRSLRGYLIGYSYNE